MKCRPVVTFEFATRAPQTARLEPMDAGGPQTIAGRAIREARRHIRPVNWTSMVVVLERLDAASEDAAAEDAVDDEKDIESETDSEGES